MPVFLILIRTSAPRTSLFRLDQAMRMSFILVLTHNLFPELRPSVVLDQRGTQNVDLSNSVHRLHSGLDRFGNCARHPWTQVDAVDARQRYIDINVGSWLALLLEDHPKLRFGPKRCPLHERDRKSGGSG